MSAQIGQKSCATSARPVGRGTWTSSLGGRALASALAPAPAGAMWSRCTWPNDTASWNASATSARYEPNLEYDRNQPIVVTFRAPDRAEPFLPTRSETLVTMLHYDNQAGSRFLGPVAKSHH